MAKLVEVRQWCHPGCATLRILGICSRGADGPCVRVDEPVNDYIQLLKRCFTLWSLRLVGVVLLIGGRQSLVGTRLIGVGKVIVSRWRLLQVALKRSGLE